MICPTSWPGAASVPRPDERDKRDERDGRLACSTRSRWCFSGPVEGGSEGCTSSEQTQLSLGPRVVPEKQINAEHHHGRLDVQSFLIAGAGMTMMTDHLPGPSK